jgi:hypothetical protein
MVTMTSAPPDIRAIGCCSVASCRRAATRHVVLEVAGQTITGTVCEHCERATRLALFLVALRAA